MKIVKSQKPYEKSSDFDEIWLWHTTADLELGDRHVTKYIFFNSRCRMAAIYKNRFFWPQVISRLSDFSEILHEETVILRISAMGQSIRVLQNVFFVFLMQFGVW